MLSRGLRGRPRVDRLLDRLDAVTCAPRLPFHDSAQLPFSPAPLTHACHSSTKFRASLVSHAVTCAPRLPFHDGAQLPFSPAPLTHACHFLLAMLCHWLLPASSQGSAHNQHVWTVFFVDTAKNALVFSIRIQYDSQYGAMIHHQSTCNRPAFAAEVGERSAQPSVGGVLAPCSA